MFFRRRLLFLSNLANSFSFRICFKKSFVITHLNVQQLGLVVRYKILVGLPVHGPKFYDLEEAVAGGEAQAVVATPGPEPDVALVQLV